MPLLILIHMMALLIEFGFPGARALGIADGTPVNAATTNAAFMYKNIIETSMSADSSSTGSSQNITLGNPFVSFTNASLASIQNLTYANKSAAAMVVLKNKTGASLTLINDSGGTAAYRILTGAGANVAYSDGAVIQLMYDTVNTRWQVMGSSVAIAPPTGSIIMTAATSCPAGYIAADGTNQNLTRTGGVQCGGGTCVALFAAISTTYGAADGTHFYPPDLRGVFPRGAGSQTISAITYTGTQGTTQGDAFQGHYHNLIANFVNYAGSDGANYGGSSSGSVKFDTAHQVTAPISDGSNGTPRTGTETRPANISVLYCIKY